MDPSKVMPLLEQLDDEIDDLEESLAPLLKTVLSETTSKLPLLDKAKLYVLVTYAIESMLFSYLRLNGVDARQHAVFTELTRVKQYFEKVAHAENPPKRTMELDKGVAGRFITAGLAGNDKWDEERANQVAGERARAHIKFEELTEKMKQDEISKKRKAEHQPESDSGSGSDSDSDSDSSSSAPSPPPKKLKKLKGAAANDSLPTSASEKSKDTLIKKGRGEKMPKKGKQRGMKKKKQLPIST